MWSETRLHDLLAERFAPETLLEQLADTQNCGFLIASVGSKPVGYLKTNWQQPDPTTSRPAAELQNLYVDATLTNRGIGTRLLRAGLILAREQLEDVVWLQVLVDNEDGQRFYRKNGFVPIGQIPFNTDLVNTAMTVMIVSLAAGMTSGAK